MIEDVRPEGCICELCSGISPNHEDMRSKFGYTMLYDMTYPVFDLFRI